jgi:hypothetical protein
MVKKQSKACINRDLSVKNVTQKISHFLLFFLAILTTIQPQIYPAAQNFMQPLLSFAAKMSAIWQLCNLLRRYFFFYSELPFFGWWRSVKMARH